MYNGIGDDMSFVVDEVTYPVVIVKKNNKNAYIRIKDHSVYVTVPCLYSEKKVNLLLKEHEESIKKMIEKSLKREEKEEGFWYLGKKYQIIETPLFEFELMNDKLYVKSEKTLMNVLDKKRKELFLKRLDYWYHQFEEKIPYPTLKIRKMKTRWGVCNKKNNTVTLNSELIKYSMDKLDYVIIHELSHFKHFDHSSSFWKLVEKYEPNYKKIRKELR